MGAKNARKLAAAFIGAGFGIGALLGLIVGGIREVWIYAHATR
jgi:hypothetical protein